MSKLFSFKPGVQMTGRKFKGLRGWAGKPSHPPLTDFPIAAYVLVGVFDVISAVAGEGSTIAKDFFVSATHVLIAGAVVSLGTALTGFWDWWKGMGREPAGLIGKAQRTQAWRTANAHMLAMVTVTVVVIVDIIVRLAQWDEAYTEPPALILSLVAALAVIWGAFYGGELVYDFGFNVEVAGDNPVWHESEEDLGPGREGFPAQAP